MHKFTLADTQTGRKRTFDFYVHDSQPLMREYLDQHNPIQGGWQDTLGATVVGGWWEGQAPELVGEVHYNQDHLDISTLTHEVAHIALTAYRQDCTMWDSRTRYHIATDNEVIPTLIGGLMEALAEELLSKGYYTEGASLGS